MGNTGALLQRARTVNHGKAVTIQRFYRLRVLQQRIACAKKPPCAAPPGLFLNIDTMKCQRCSPGKYQQNFNSNPVTPSIGCPNVWEDCNRLRKPILRIGSYTQNNLCGEECEEGKNIFIKIVDLASNSQNATICGR